MPRKKVDKALRTNLLLAAAGCLAVSGGTYWQYSSGANTPIASASRQLTMVEPPAGVTAVRPSVPSPAEPKAAAIVAPAKTPNVKALQAKAPAITTVPAHVITDPRPAANVVEGRENAVPPPALAPNRSRAATFETMARVSLQKRDYAEARESIESALAHGGNATFTVVHDHSRGNFEADDPKATCVGALMIGSDGIKFETRGEGDRFAANWVDVKDVGSNRFFGSGRGGFHLSVGTGGKYKNFNLAPESKDKAEAKLILDLLNSYTRGADRTR